MRHSIRPQPRVTAAILLGLLAVGCSAADPQPDPAPAPLETVASATAAEAAPPAAAFRAAFESGAYEALPDLVRMLTGAHLARPDDPEITLLLAHAHLWRIAEAGRAGGGDPTVTSHLVLAAHFFEEAARLAPDDHRIPGWLGSALMPLGRLHGNPERVEEGYAMLQAAVERYPEFNHFTAAVALSAYPPEDARFGEALEHLRRNIERCSGVTDGPVAAPESIYGLAAAQDPSCANTPGAPHNFEGFVLTYGDLLWKAGRTDDARAMYARARGAPTYEEWPYRGTLDDRIESLRAGVSGPPEITPGSAYACAACHVRR